MELSTIMMCLVVLALVSIVGFVGALAQRDGWRGLTLYSLPWRTLMWLGKGGSFWKADLPAKL